jgi:tRNA(Ile)-lysidine synthase
LELGVTLYVERVSLDTSGSESLEKLARDARYGALKTHLHKGDVLLTGQHQDDQLETFLLALKRGSGPKGLSSMAKVMSIGEATLMRPLIGSSRQEIEAYAKHNGLTWVEDESNQDQRFDRNFIRHEVTPKLVERWPSFPESVARSAQLCAEQELLLDELITPKLDQALGLHNSLKIESVLGCSSLMRARLLRMWLSKSGLTMPSQKQLALLWSEVACAQQDANPVLVLGDAEVRRFDNRLFIVESRPSLETWQAEIQLGQSLELPDQLGFLSLRTNGGEALKGSEDSLELSLSSATNPLKVIFNPESLVAHPVGRGHSRKMKKLFQEYKIPSWLRRRTPILMDGENVVAVMGLFVDKRYQGQDCEAVWSK